MSSTSDAPRYLFRAYSPGSEGSNSAKGFSLMGERNRCSRVASLGQLLPQEACDMLQDHVTWQSWRKRGNDIFISFTSSLLFALQHCVRKIATCKRGTTDRNCYICVIDTSKYLPGTFSSTISLLKKYKLDESTHPLLWHQYHEAEYLAEHEVVTSTASSTASSEHVSFYTLVNQGDLYSTVPELKEKQYEHQLFNRLQQLRRLWYKEEETITPQDIDNARRLALCFGDQWLPVIMIWALAMRARPQEEGLLEAYFADGFWGEITTPFLFTDTRTEIPPSMKELAEWQRLMSRAYSAQTRAALQGTEPVATQPEDGKSEDLAGMLEGMKI